MSDPKEKIAIYGIDAADKESLAGSPPLHAQLKALEEMCLSEWRDPETGELPKGWRPDSYIISYGDAASSCYAVEFSGLQDWTSHSYDVSLSGFQMVDGVMTDLLATNVSVTDQTAPEVTYVDETLEPSPDQNTEILNLYSDILQDLLNPHQAGVRIEIRFVKVREVKAPNMMTTTVTEGLPKSLPGILGVLDERAQNAPVTGHH